MHHKCESGRLIIGSQNIQGNLGNKCSTFEFLDIVREFDIFCMQETWLTNEQSFQVPGYNYFRSDRTKNKKAKRGSGGVVVLYKSELQPAIEKVKSNNKHTIWIKIRKSYFGLNNDWYSASVYIPPENLPYSNKIDYFEALNKEVAYYASI